MMRRQILAVISLCLVVAVGSLVLIIGCAPQGNVDHPGETTPVEIREYEGEDLSSVGEFRENSIAGPQYINLETYALAVTGLVDNPLVLTFDEVIGHQSYEKVVTLHCVEGWSVTILWQGVLVSDLIDQAQASPEARAVIFHAYDGYTTSLPLEYIRDGEILLAYKMNGVMIPPERGAPFELVAESKWGYKWIKWVTEIELTDDVDYRGFWESRGYSNSADLDEGFFLR